MYDVAPDKADHGGFARGDAVRRPRERQARRLLGGLGGAAHRPGKGPLDVSRHHQRGLRVRGAPPAGDIPQSARHLGLDKVYYKQRVIKFNCIYVFRNYEFVALLYVNVTFLEQLVNGTK